MGCLGAIWPPSAEPPCPRHPRIPQRHPRHPRIPPPASPASQLRILAFHRRILSSPCRTPTSPHPPAASPASVHPTLASTASPHRIHQTPAAAAHPLQAAPCSPRPRPTPEQADWVLAHTPGRSPALPRTRLICLRAARLTRLARAPCPQRRLGASSSGQLPPRAEARSGGADPGLDPGPQGVPVPQLLLTGAGGGVGLHRALRPGEQRRVHQVSVRSTRGRHPGGGRPTAQRGCCPRGVRKPHPASRASDPWASWRL